ncbi:MAG: MFS transporter [Acidimicrobiia bacterium]|nr:MFS transporter [Acidimicrobiia bacterium]
MASIVNHHRVDDAGLGALRQPRQDIVAENAAGEDRFELAHGPFRRYRRTLEVRSEAAGATHQVTERIEFSVAAALWRPLLTWPVRRALRRPRRPGWQPWWAPPERLSSAQSTTLALLTALNLVSAYLGTTLSQTLTFVADDFNADPGAQGLVLAVARVGVVVTLAATALADRAGRRLVRPLLTVACLILATTALAPSLALFGLAQTLTRGLTTGVDIVILVLAAEMMPARCRAWAASIITLVGGLGSGMVVWLLPLADRSEGAWRLLYLPPLLFAPLVWWAGRRLPESGRFEAARASRAEPRSPDRAKPTGIRAVRGRLVLLGLAAFLLLAFAAPAGQFQNEFLRSERGYTAARITLFTLVTSTPAGVGVFLGGRLAERYGRRAIGATGICLGTICTATAYFSFGWTLWLWSVAGTITAGLTVPAMRVYGPELFPTHLRSRANGITTVAGVSGSATGVLLTGMLADRAGSLSWPIAMLAVGPIIVAILVISVYPETARRTLEELNPEDAPLDDAPIPGAPTHPQ